MRSELLLYQTLLMHANASVLLRRYIAAQRLCCGVRSLKSKSAAARADECDMPNENRRDQHDRNPQNRDSASACDLDELIERFLQELPDNMRKLQDALASGDEQQIRRVSQQLKGSATRSGYPSISETASILERAMLEEEAHLSSIEERVEDLISLCRRAAAAESQRVEFPDGESDL